MKSSHGKEVTKAQLLEQTKRAMLKFEIVSKMSCPCDACLAADIAAHAILNRINQEGRTLPDTRLTKADFDMIDQVVEEAWVEGSRQIQEMKRDDAQSKVMAKEVLDAAKRP